MTQRKLTIYAELAGIISALIALTLLVIDFFPQKKSINEGVKQNSFQENNSGEDVKQIQLNLTKHDSSRPIIDSLKNMTREIAIKPKKNIISENNELGFFIDARDNNRYEIKKFGSQIWFLENLKFNSVGSTCYNDNKNNCEKFGRLYPYASLLEAVPKGWHIPSRLEFSELSKYIIDSSTKSSTYINLNKNNSFQILSNGGYYFNDRSKYYRKEYKNDGYIYFWLTDEGSNEYAYAICLYPHNIYELRLISANLWRIDKQFRVSLRLIKDNN